MKVALLPTGLTEWHGLAGALKSLFPADPPHEFYVVPSATELRSDSNALSQGFTSSTLHEGHVQTPPEAARELVERAAQEAIGDRSVEPADLVIVLDDLELANAGQAGLVCRVFAAAVTAHLAGLPTGRIAAKTERVLREQVSFHLSAPMIEALFFADVTALTTAGVPDAAAVASVVQCDPEDFRTADPAYLVATAAECPCWSRLPESTTKESKRKRKLRPKWLGAARERHPKGYLQWLCRDREARTCTRYQESEHGGRALAGLCWDAVLARPDEQLRFLRALVADLEDGLEQVPSAGTVTEVQAPETSRFSPRRCPVLRNL